MKLKELAREIHKPIIRKFEERELCLSLIDNNWDADLAGMLLISKFDEVFFLPCVIDIFS